MLTAFHGNLNRLKHHFCHLLNVQVVNGALQVGLGTADPPVPEPSFRTYYL